MYDAYDNLTARLRSAGDWLWPLALRLIMFWEFWEAGITKLRGNNWFADIPWADWQKGFPWPFTTLSTDLNWFAATWGELLFSVLILLGLFTRFAAISLIVITTVATAAVHWARRLAFTFRPVGGLRDHGQGRRQFQIAVAVHRDPAATGIPRRGKGQS